MDNNDTIPERGEPWKLFMVDIANVMVKHGVENLVAIYSMNGNLRNTYIPLAGETPLYCHISDALYEWLRNISIE